MQSGVKNQNQNAKFLESSFGVISANLFDSLELFTEEMKHFSISPLSNFNSTTITNPNSTQTPENSLVLFYVDNFDLITIATLEGICQQYLEEIPIFVLIKEQQQPNLQTTTAKVILLSLSHSTLFSHILIQLYFSHILIQLILIQPILIQFILTFLFSHFHSIYSHSLTIFSWK